MVQFQDIWGEPAFTVHSFFSLQINFMDTHFLLSSPSFHLRIQNHVQFFPTSPSTTCHATICFKYSICGHLSCSKKWKKEQRTTLLAPQKHYGCITRAQKDPIDLSDEAFPVKNVNGVEKKKKKKKKKKKGSVAGAVALIIGTSIGSGILALPIKASPAGVIPSSISMIVCWAFLLIEALLLVEINVGLRRKMGRRGDENELEVISLRTMAQQTLGDWGATLASITYVFLSYTSMVAYSSKSGEILFHLLNVPESVSSCFFAAIFAVLISAGGTQVTDQVNQWLTVSMIGLLLGIEVVAVGFGGWSGLEGGGDWGKVPASIPVMIFALVYHDLVPVLCAYLGGDLMRLRASILLGSLVPLVTFLGWDAIALGFSTHTDQVVDPVELLMSVGWSGFSYMVEAFSLLAVGTSVIGTLLGFSEFFKEQLKNLSFSSKMTQEVLQKPEEKNGLRKWWGVNKISYAAMAMAIAPALIVSTTVPDAFSAATDIAGGYCMTVLYGVLPPAMAWAMYIREPEDISQRALSRARPALVGVGVCACAVVVEQILQDFFAFHP